MALTTKEAADRLGVTQRAIQKWIKQGYFPGVYRVNPHSDYSHYRIPDEDIEQFEKSRGTAPTE